MAKSNIAKIVLWKKNLRVNLKLQKAKLFMSLRQTNIVFFVYLMCSKNVLSIKRQHGNKEQN